MSSSASYAQCPAVCYSGFGGPAYSGYGGPCYKGFGGPCYGGLEAEKTALLSAVVAENKWSLQNPVSNTK